MFRTSKFHLLASLTGLRFITTSNRCLAVDKSLLSKLRKQTGISFINCKKALEKYENDFDQAKQWLQEQAQKEGWAKATKLQTRPMSQGLVAVFGDDRHATLLEVNCETDFVARNEKFIAMVTKLAQECNSYLSKQTDQRVNLNQEELNRLATSEKSTLADILALTVGNLGENMALRRAAFIRASHPSSLICSYVHPSNSSKKQQGLRLGKYGAVVEVQPTGAVKGNNSGESEAPVMDIQDVGNHLCQHIVGMNPKSVGEFPPSSKSDTTPSGANAAAGEVEQGEGEDSPTSQTQQADEEEELLSQEFLLDSSMTVGELVCLNGLEVKDFVRFACGEELDSDKTV